jgi:hypothetical protein
MATRSYFALATALLVGVILPATTVEAKPPDRIPPAGIVGPFDIPPEQSGCGVVTLSFVDQQRGAVFFDQSGAVTKIHFAGRLTATVSGESGTVDLHISGPVKITDQVVLTGPMLLFANPGDAPLLEYVHGRAAIGEGGLDQARITGHRVDLCSIVGA